MKNKLILLLLILAIVSQVHAQKHDYNWIFGSFTYPDGELGNHTGNILNFSGDTVTLGLYEKKDDLEFTSTMYSDSLGTLRFWSNGCEIFDAENNVMQGGDTLNPGLIYESFCVEGEYSAYLGAHQGIISLPDLLDERYVYVFYKWTPWGFQGPYELRYSVIDTEANDGLGKVIKRRIPLVSDVTSGLLTAVKSADLQSWWILAPELESSVHNIFHLTSDSIIGPKTYDQGVDISRDNHSASASAFSPDGGKYAIFGEADGLRIYDFDRALGELSNYEYIAPPGDFDGGWVGLDFSASGRFLYTCHWLKIYQYDMHAADIGASRVTVANWEEHFDPDFNVPTMFFNMQRAPDCRIYLSARNRTKTMHVIHYPDRKGEACMVQQNIPIPAYNTITLSNFPNYRLGTSEVCDSTKMFPQELLMTSISSVASNESKIEVQVFPNPSRGLLNFVFEDALAEALRLQIHSVEGILMYESDIDQGLDAVRLDISHLPRGIYAYTLWEKQLPVHAGRLVLVE